MREIVDFVKCVGLICFQSHKHFGGNPRFVGWPKMGNTCGMDQNAHPTQEIVCGMGILAHPTSISDGFWTNSLNILPFVGWPKNLLLCGIDFFSIPQMAKNRTFLACTYFTKSFRSPLPQAIPAWCPNPAWYAQEERFCQTNNTSGIPERRHLRRGIILRF